MPSMSTLFLFQSDSSCGISAPRLPSTTLSATPTDMQWSCSPLPAMSFLSYMVARRQRGSNAVVVNDSPYSLTVQLIDMLFLDVHLLVNLIPECLLFMVLNAQSCQKQCFPFTHCWSFMCSTRSNLCLRAWFLSKCSETLFVIDGYMSQARSKKQREWRRLCLCEKRIADKMFSIAEASRLCWDDMGYSKL